MNETLKCVLSSPMLKYKRGQGITASGFNKSLKGRVRGNLNTKYEIEGKFVKNPAEFLAQNYT